MPTPTISFRNVSKDYTTPSGTFRALRDIDLEILEGEHVALVGKSGSGKSSLLHLMGGIDAATSGTVTVAGMMLGSGTESAVSAWRGRQIGFVFQFFQLLPTLTALENVLLPMDFAGVIPAAQRRQRALRLLGELGVEDQAAKLPAMLSGGQQQRVAVARALANDPPVLLADEPTGNLDSETANSLLRLLFSLGKTVVLATHERDLGARVSRTLHLVDGRVQP